MTAYTERQPAPAGKPPGAVTFLVADIDPAAHPVWPGDAPALLHAAVDSAAAAHAGAARRGGRARGSSRSSARRPTRSKLP